MTRDYAPHWNRTNARHVCRCFLVFGVADFDRLIIAEHFPPYRFDYWTLKFLMTRPTGVLDRVAPLNNYDFHNKR